MNHAQLAVKLVERHGLTSGQALKYVLEGDADAAAKAMAKNAAPDDKKKQQEMEPKFKAQMTKEMGDCDTKDDK